MVTMGMYCRVCEQNGAVDDGFQYFEMELTDVKELDCERSIHTYEGVCPECGTLHRYVSNRVEVQYEFYDAASDDSGEEPKNDPGIRRILYALYLREWYATHDEGDPVCFSEFVDNEYRDREWMTELMSSRTLTELTEEYRRDMQEAEE